MKRATESLQQIAADRKRRLGNTPRITNLNEDAQFCGMVVHFICEGTSNKASLGEGL